jgi:hypothetical protein
MKMIGTHYFDDLGVKSPPNQKIFNLLKENSAKITE